MLSNGHAGFGGRSEETHQWKRWQGASGRPNWPDIFVMGEGDEYELRGMAGAWEAAAAMRGAGGPAYVPLPCSLQREAGMFAPVIYVDPQKVVVRRFYWHRLPDFAARNRNLLVFSLPDRADPIRLVAGPGDIYSGEFRLADARAFRRLVDPAFPCMLLGDWNTVPGGPSFEPRDLNTFGTYTPGQLAYRIRWEHGPRQTGPHVYDSRAMDFLCGWWNPSTGKREGGIGFTYAADLAKDYTPTQIGPPDGRQPLAIDGFLLNEPATAAYVDGSYRVHDFRDPQDPDSDHKRVSITVDI